VVACIANRSVDGYGINFIKTLSETRPITWGGFFFDPAGKERELP
jgi:hypothetical protein